MESLQIPVTFDLAGVFARRSEASQVRCGDPVRIVPEPTNPYDAKALAVFHEDRLIGYIPRVRQSKMTPYMEQNVQFEISNHDVDYIQIRTRDT